MKKLFTLVCLVTITLLSNAQTFCHQNGNVIIYSNYDGGYLNINVDQNIPNLKIGITTYEKCEVTFSGPYVNNITQVIYAGYNANNNHCNPSPATTVINGAPAGTDTIILIPSATWSNANGYSFIICNYSCDSATNQGGCNTPDQIVHYYLTNFGGSLYYHFTQYGCWSGTYNVSAGGNCCIGANLIQPTGNIQAGFTMTADTICSNDTMTYMNTSTNTYPGNTHYNWDFGDGTAADTSVNPMHAFLLPGTYTITMIATNSGNTASDTFSSTITVIDCIGAGVTDLSVNGFSVYPDPAGDRLIVTGYGLSGDKNREVNIFDLAGRKMNCPVSASDLSVDVSKLTTGIYFISVQTKYGKVIGKFVKE